MNVTPQQIKNSEERVTFAKRRTISTAVLLVVFLVLIGVFLNQGKIEGNFFSYFGLACVVQLVMVAYYLWVDNVHKKLLKQAQAEREAQENKTDEN